MVKSTLEDVEYMQELNIQGDTLASRGYPHIETSLLNLYLRESVCLTEDQVNAVYSKCKQV